LPSVCPDKHVRACGGADAAAAQAFHICVDLDLGRYETQDLIGQGIP